MKNYPAHYQHLLQFMAQLGESIPTTMKAFNALHQTNHVDGALPAKFKELIALGIAIAVHCDGCIAFHVHDAIKAGASEAEIMETIGVAILMGGGPAVVYGSEAMEALQQFQSTPEFSQELMQGAS